MLSKQEGRKEIEINSREDRMAERIIVVIAEFREIVELKKKERKKEEKRKRRLILCMN